MSISNSKLKTTREIVAEQADKILSRLKCTDIVRKETMTIITRADELGLLSKGKPKSLAAGSIYIAAILSHDRMTLDAIGYAAGVSSGTVGKYYMMIARGLGYSERSPDLE